MTVKRTEAGTKTIAVINVHTKSIAIPRTIKFFFLRGDATSGKALKKG
jgi:hypothetical protein